MKKKINLLCFWVLSCLLLMNCSKDEPSIHAHNGAEQKLGNGKVYSSVTFSAEDVPTSLSLVFTKGALENLSHTDLTELVIKLPTEAVGKTLFDHIFLTFSHTGHEPPGIYDVAHFDIHFMLQPLAERLLIPPYGPTTAAKFDNLPPDGYMPVPYFRLPAGVPLMGTHWANPTSTELNGGKFTQTLILGSYDGKLTFVEPMITLTTLQSSPNLSFKIPQPTKFAIPGLYPTDYSIKQVGDKVVVSLDNLIQVK